MSSTDTTHDLSVDQALAEGLFSEAGTLHLLSFGADGFPPYAATEEQRFRWVAAWELSAGVARGHGADPGVVNMFTTHAVRSLYWDESVPTYGAGKTVETWLRTKHRHDLRRHRRVERRARLSRLFRRHDGPVYEHR